MNQQLRATEHTPTGASDEGRTDQRVHSVLFAAPDKQGEPATEPSFFADLNLGQMVETIVADQEEHELAEFFYEPLHDPAQVDYRHEVLNDLDREEIAGAVGTFVATMREMRDRLSLSAKVHDVRQRQRWFLAAVDAYCGAVEQLEVSLNDVLPGSAALRGLRTFTVAYGRSQEFVELKAETQQLIDELGQVRYTIRSKGLQITVDRFADEADLTQEVQATFARFRQHAAKNYRARFLEHAANNQVESWILELVAELNPDLFARVAQFCTARADYLDPTLARFDREIHFYLGYLRYIEPLKAAGVAFCLPTVSSESKQITARGACDLVLARKLVADGVETVPNDFELSGPERILVVTGPNQGGKTTFSRMFGQLHHLSALGLPVPARHASLFLPDRMFSHFEREEDIRSPRSKFEEELVRIHEILEQASERSILIMNESFGSTTAADALRVGRRVLERVIELDIICVCVTFVDELSELGEATVSMMSTVDADDLTRRTFRVIRKPADGLAYAVALAQRHELGYDQLKRRLAR
jgi:DNA mismatch repair protein MutS